jgi:hypothetical protein
LIFFFFILPTNNLNFVQLVYGGECFDSREDMLNDYKASISIIIQHPDKKNYNFGPWIEHCWSHWDPSYRDGELNNELGNAILVTLRNPKIPREVKIKSLEIVCSAAPSNQ